MNTFNVKELGQVFTPQYIVSDMMNLIQNNGRFLEPSCGDGAFFKNLPSNKVGIEIDKNVINDEQILNIDFFNYPLNEKFDTIVGNPPYVKYQDIKIETKILLKIYNQIFDERSNLYLFFIYKCILHLKDKGELIFITPRDFLKSTSSIKLNNF
ncbi:class I SAM-dependent methyltransferase, partial [Campylobacter coli]|nr:class I SAM-dependent methyltransferase [Campylobacter coli]